MRQALNVEGCNIPVGLAMRPSIRQQLVERKIRLEDELERVNEALDSLNSNPEIADALEKLTKAVNIY